MTRQTNPESSVPVEKGDEEQIYEYQRKRLKNMADAMERLKPRSEGGFYPYKNEAAYDLVHEAQSLAVSARRFSDRDRELHSRLLRRKEFMKIFDIQICRTPEGWYKIDMPLLLPSNRNFVSPWFIREPLAVAVDQYRARYKWKSMVPVIRYNAVIIRGFYDRTKPYRALRDRFNIESNAVVDEAAVLAMDDDSARECFHLYTSEPADRDYTEILVMPQECLEPWCRENPLSERLPVYRNSPEMLENIEGYGARSLQLEEMAKILNEIVQAKKSGPFDLYKSRLNDFFMTAQDFALWTRSLPHVIEEIPEPLPAGPFDASSGIQIELHNRIMRIVLPDFLPKKDSGEEPWPLRDQLAAALRRYFSGRKPLPMAGGIAVFVQSYRGERGKGFYRDNDNIDVSSVLDQMRPYCNGFNPMYAPHFYMAKTACEECTEVFLMPVSSFPDWLKGQNIPEKD